MVYIPKQHIQYNLLPMCRKRGREVFSYPDLSEIERLITNEEECARLTPYGYASYNEYYSYVDTLITNYGMSGDTFNTLGDQLTSLKRQIDKMNRKENWSVLQYVGVATTKHVWGLTHGRHYYWPCSLEKPLYEGVIDDEEFTSYLYPPKPSLWILKEDPTGMALRTLKTGSTV